MIISVKLFNNFSVLREFRYSVADVIVKSVNARKFSCTTSRVVNISVIERKSTFCFNRCYSSDSYFSVSDYDCVGFDLDHTICEYNLNNVIRHEYGILADYLVEQRGHDKGALLKPLSASDVDFIQKGLIVDTFKGNLLRIRRDGFIFRACHGSKLLTNEEIEKCYGSDKKWCVSTDFAQNPVIAWNGPVSEKLRTLADYFDAPAAIALNRCLDSRLASSSCSVDCYSIWQDVLKALIYIYDRKCFSLNIGYFKSDLKVNPGSCYKKCRPSVINWLKELKKSKVTFLVTGSNADHASHTAEYCLGENWRDYFDIVICFSRKPGFFVGGRPFVKLSEFIEVNPIDNNEIKMGEIYSQGNWEGLHQLFSKVIKKSNPKCLYIGDNLIQDIFTASEYTCCDTIAVSEELGAEFVGHPHKEFLVSETWGSYFTDNGMCSLWGDIIQNYSKICIPSLEVLASKPFDYRYSTFSGKSSGYHLLTMSLDPYNFSNTKKHDTVLA